MIALDWTDFENDDHATLAAHLITTHGRATPLLWMTVPKSTLEGQRNAHEHKLIEKLHECIAATVRITLLADRGFGDQKRYGMHQTLGLVGFHSRVAEILHLHRKFRAARPAERAAHGCRGCAPRARSRRTANQVCFNEQG